MELFSFNKLDSNMGRLTPVKIVLIYVAVVGLWIPFSDILIGALIKNVTVFTYVKIFKDYSYVMTTAWILYTLMNRNMEMIERSKTALITINTKLRSEIAERRQIEAVLRKTEEEKKVILDSMSECVVYLGKKKEVLWTNRAASEALKLNLDKLIGCTCKDLCYYEKESCRGCPVERVLVSGKPGEGEFSTFEGRTWLLKVYPVFDKDDNSPGKVRNVVIVALEITEQKRAQEERMRLVTAVEQAAEGIIITTSKGVIKYVNPAFETITGYSADQVLGKSPRILKSGRHSQAFYRNMWSNLKSGKTWSGRIINKRQDGTLYEEETTISPVQNSKGEIINYVAVKRDVTQEVALEAQLRQAQKMEAIGTLAGGIAHDFNNILTPIIINTEMALLDLPPDNNLHQELSQVLEAGKRAKDLVKQILTFSRQKEEEQSPLVISSIVKEALKLIRSTLPATIDIRSTIEAHSAIVMADPTRIHQIIMNLCTNAAHAMADKGGILDIYLCLKNLYDDFLLPYPELKAGPYVCLRVSDTGEGIKPEVMDKIFDPFFTTRKLGEGTGLGLSVVHGILKNCGGAATVDSRIGKGTVVEILLPLYSEDAIDKAKDFSSLPTGEGLILFVDDEKEILSSGKKLLERLGYTVETHNSSIEARDVFVQQPDKYDLVITDYTMAHMTGIELAHEIRALRSHMPIIIITGYSDTKTRQKAKDIGIDGFIIKPLISQHVAETVKKVMKSKY